MHSERFSILTFKTFSGGDLFIKGPHECGVIESPTTRRVPSGDRDRLGRDLASLIKQLLVSVCLSFYSICTSRR